MADIPEGAKKPTDRKAKNEDAVDEAFSFEHDGETYTFAPTLDALTPGFIRRNRGNEVEFTFSLLEELADDDTLDVLDGMTLKENTKVLRAFDKHVEQTMKVSLGE